MQALRSFWLRDTAGKMGYFDKQLGDKDAVRVGRVIPHHQFLFSSWCPKVYCQFAFEDPRSNTPSTPLSEATRILSKTYLEMVPNGPKLSKTEKLVQVHTFKPGWMDASAAFMRSGGYKVSKRISDVQQDTAVVWGENDEVLDPKDAQAFVKILPHAK